MSSVRVNFPAYSRVDKCSISIKQVINFLIITLVFLFVITLVGCGDGAEKAVKTASNNDSWQFKILNAEFSIPRKYSKGGARTRDGALETANLWALLPSFEGYDKDINHHDFYEVYHKGRRIQIMLITRSRRMTVPQVVAKQNARKEYSVLGGRHQGGKYDEMRYGLEHYHTDFSAPSIYLFRKKEKPEILFKCSEDYLALFPGCQGLWDYNDEVAVEFDFGAQYLPQWEDIMVNLKKLLDGELN